MHVNEQAANLTGCTTEQFNQIAEVLIDFNEVVQQRIPLEILQANMKEFRNTSLYQQASTEGRELAEQASTEGRELAELLYNKLIQKTQEGLC